MKRLMAFLLLLSFSMLGIGQAQDPRLPVTDKDAEAAQKKLNANPDDPEANLIAGIHTASKGDWPVALAQLAKAKLKEVQDAAGKDIAGAPGGTLDQFENGDLWLTAAAKLPRYKQFFQLRAFFWYDQCWAQLDPVRKDLLRTRLKKALSNPVGQAFSPTQQLNGWPLSAGKVSSGLLYTVSGKKSLRLEPEAKLQYTFLATPEMQAQQGKEYVLSGWGLTEGNDSPVDCVKLDVFAQGLKVIDIKKLILTQDTPYWKYFTYKDSFPQNGVICRVTIELASKMGAIWVDDVSLKVDGKEMLKNGSFE